MRETIFALCVLFATSAHAQPAGRISPEEAVLRFNNAVRALDVPTMTAMMAPEVTAFVSNDTPRGTLRRVHGRDALLKLIATATAKPLPPMAASAMQDTEVQRIGPVAIVTYHVGSGNRVGRRTFVLRETDSGWVVTHQHASTFVSGDAR
jgi:ketosteroid isomerase-like protein